jgi:hypothetical protein
MGLGEDSKLTYINFDPANPAEDFDKCSENDTMICKQGRRDDRAHAG